MPEKEFNHRLLANILSNTLTKDYVKVDTYNDIHNTKNNFITPITKKDIIKLAHALLPLDILINYPEFEIKKPDLFSKLNDATIEADNVLEYKHNILYQICLNVMEEFPELNQVSVESVEHNIIKIMCLQNQIENSTYIAINDEQQLKQNIQDFLKKIENN